MTEQLHLELFPEIRALLADAIVDRRRIHTGAQRLLIALVRQGLDETALIPAAGMALLLDRRRDE